MRKYELFTVLRPNLDIDEVENAIKKIEDSIQSLGGNVSKVDKLGRKKLAYEIKSFRDGFSAVINYELEPAKTIELKRILKLNEDVLRVMLLVDEAKAVAK